MTISIISKTICKIICQSFSFENTYKYKPSHVKSKFTEQKKRSNNTNEIESKQTNQMKYHQQESSIIKHLMDSTLIETNPQ